MQLAATNCVQIAFLCIYFAAGMDVGDVIRHDPLQCRQIGMLQGCGAGMFGLQNLLTRIDGHRLYGCGLS